MADRNLLGGLQLKSEIEGVVKDATRSTDEDFPAFLQTSLATCIEGRNEKCLRIVH